MLTIYKYSKTTKKCVYVNHKKYNVLNARMISFTKHFSFKIISCRRNKVIISNVIPPSIDLKHVGKHVGKQYTSFLN